MSRLQLLFLIKKHATPDTCWALYEKMFDRQNSTNVKK